MAGRRSIHVDLGGRKEAEPATLPSLSKRNHVRVVVPPSVQVNTRLRSRSFGTCRGTVTDISAGGMALILLEGSRFEPPQEGEEVTGNVDYEASDATIIGRVVRASARELSIRFRPTVTDDMINLDLLGLIAQVVTRKVDHVDRERFASSLSCRLVHNHFYGAGYLDVRIQREVTPRWWQLVFLEFMVSYSEASGVGTGIIDRSFTADRTADALSLKANVTRHPAPWRSLVQLAQLIARRCMHAQPRYAEDFLFMQATLTR